MRVSFYQIFGESNCKNVIAQTQMSTLSLMGFLKFQDFRKRRTLLTFLIDNMTRHLIVWLICAFQAARSWKAAYTDSILCVVVSNLDVQPINYHLVVWQLLANRIVSCQNCAAFWTQRLFSLVFYDEFKRHRK